MRAAAHNTLKALYEGQTLTQNQDSRRMCSTRLPNEILWLRQHDITIHTEKEYLSEHPNPRWQGRYRLDRSPENLQRVREMLGIKA